MKRNISWKLKAIALVGLLFAACGGGGGGGGGGSSSPSTTVGTIRPNIELPNGNSIAREGQNTMIREVETKDIIKARSFSTEPIPQERNYATGSKSKIAVLDSDFEHKQAELQKKYPNMIKVANKEGNQSEHGIKVLSLAIGDSSLQPIVASTGVKDHNPEKITPPTKTLYEEMWKHFGDQKIKVFNQSFGIPKQYGTYNAYENNQNNYKTALSNISESSAKHIESGQEMLDWYLNAVQNGGIFVWANGNIGKENGRNILFHQAYINAGLPKFERKLEQGWISAIGIITSERNGKIHQHREVHLAYPGAEAMWWAISADDSTNETVGSSFAAPRVSRAAALVSEQFSWMSNDQVRHTLFTTTDRWELQAGTEKTEENYRYTGHEPDSRYGWGVLNEKRALKGPGAFLNTKYHERYNTTDYAKRFIADIPENTISYFSNDIHGDGGLTKKGKGSLHLTGNNSYEKSTIVEAGTLEVHQLQRSEIKVENEGTLVLHSRALVGYYDPFHAIPDAKNIQGNYIKKSNVENSGIVKVKGNTAIITGDYIATASAKTELDIGDKLTVLGKVDLAGEVDITKKRYVGAIKKQTLIDAHEVINKSMIKTTGMNQVESKIEDGNLVVKLSRKNALEHLGEATASELVTAEKVEKFLEELDEKVEKGTASNTELAMGYSMQELSSEELQNATQKMSGEIYASAQALTFSQIQNMNRDVSNRLATVNTQDSKLRAWASGIGSSGKLQRKGYASGQTKVFGGQAGVDKQFSSNTRVGLAMSYSQAEAKFNRYAGRSNSEMYGLSLYGKYKLQDGYYTAGRLGAARVRTEVQRDLVDTSGTTVKGDIKHRDYIYSGYLELGKQGKVITPYIAYSQEWLTRGAFVEDDSAWGIHAEKENYRNENVIFGLRGRTQFENNHLVAYLQHQINTTDRSLAFQGRFTGSNLKEKFDGVKQAKATTWFGFGLTHNFTATFGIYGNVDFRWEDGKHADSIFTTGLQYAF